MCSPPLQGDPGPEGDPGLTVRTSPLTPDSSLAHQQKHRDDTVNIMMCFIFFPAGM